MFFSCYPEKSLWELEIEVCGEGAMRSSVVSVTAYGEGGNHGGGGDEAILLEDTLCGWS